MKSDTSPDIMKARVSAEDLAALLGKSVSTVYRLQKAGVLKRRGNRAGSGFVLAEAIPACVEHFGKPQEEKPSQEPQAPARLIEQEKLERIRIENAKLRGDWAPRVVLEHYAAQVASIVKDGLEALPGNLRKRISHLRASEVTIIKQEVAKIANAIADFNPDNQRAA